MPARPREHVLEEESCIALRALLPAEWTVEPVRRDYGLDARVEVFEGGRATGLAFWAQLKATDEPDLRRALGVSFETTSLNYLSVQADPVLLVRWHAPSRRIFGRWLHRQDIRIKRAGQKSATVRWTLPDEVAQSDAGLLADEVRRFRRLGSPASLPLSVSIATTGGAPGARPAVLALLRSAITAAAAPLTLVDGEDADIRLALSPKRIKIDTPLFTLKAEAERADDAGSLADDAAAALAVGLGGIGLPNAAVDLVLQCTGARLLRGEDAAGRIAQAFGAAGRWRDASDLMLDCLTGPPGRELLGRLLDVGRLLEPRDPSAGDARHVADNLAERARRQHASGENAGAAWYSAANWLFGTVHDYPAALRAYEAAAQARPDYEAEGYWLEETAAALFETGDFAAAAAMYARARKAADGPAPHLLPRTADCLAHAGDRTEALVLLERYVKAEPQPAGPWVLMLLALRQLAAPPPKSAESDGQDEVPWNDWPSLVHPGLGAAEELARLDEAASHGDLAAFMTVLTTACAFPAPDSPEPWEALLILSWALHEEAGQDWPLPGEVLDAALRTAAHRRGAELLRDLVDSGGPVRPELLAAVEDRLAEISTAGRSVTIRMVLNDGTRDVLEVGLSPANT